MWMSSSRRAVVYTVFLIGIRLQAQVEANAEWLAYQDSANDSDGGNEVGGPGGSGGGGSSAVVAVDDVGDGSSNESARGKGKGKGKRGKGEGNGISNRSHGSSVGQLLVWLPDELWVLIVHFLKRAHVGPLDDSGSTSLQPQQDGGGGVRLQSDVRRASACLRQDGDREGRLRSRRALPLGATGKMVIVELFAIRYSQCHCLPQARW